MSLKRRIVMMVGVCAATALTLAACSGGNSSSAKTTIKVLVSSGHQQFNPVWAKLPEFEKKTGINVQLDKVDTSDIEGTFLRDMRLGGCTIDNVEMLDGGTAAAAPYMADLDTFLTKDGTSAKQLLEGQVSWVGDALSFDNKLLYYPSYSGADAVAYRKDLFQDPTNQVDFKKQYGYPLPEPPKTPQQFIDLAHFFTKTGQYGVVFGGQGDGAETLLADLIFRNGVHGYQDEDGNALWGPKHPDNTTKVAKSAAWFTNLTSSGVAPQSVNAMATDNSVSFYASGKAAMIYDQIYLPWAQFNAPNVTSKIGKSGSFEMPGLQAGSGGITFYWGRGIPKCSKHKEASWTFLKWLMSDENLKLALSKGEGVFVPTDKELLDWAVNKKLIPTGVADAVKHASPYKVTKATGTIRKTINIPLSEKLLQGSLTPEEYAQDSGQKIQNESEKEGAS